MPNARVSSAEFLKSYGRFTEQALREPVSITSHGRDRLVLLSAEEYERLRQQDRQARYPSELSPEELRALEAPDAPAGFDDALRARPDHEREAASAYERLARLREAGPRIDRTSVEMLNEMYEERELEREAFRRGVQESSAPAPEPTGIDDDGSGHTPAYRWLIRRRRRWTPLDISSAELLRAMYEDPEP
jgi:PHD/YefM family antitoxin component YafN of YafNO toxin-antitoxin module